MSVPALLIAATFLPLVGALAGLTARWWRPRKDDRAAGFVASACILGSFGLALTAALRWDGPEPIAGSWYEIFSLAGVTLELGHHIDSLTLTMFCLVSLVASCVCVFALGYLSDELTHEHRDHSFEEELVRPGRFHLFFGYLCLFVTAMLLLVIGGNLFHVFVGWELVGACSYLLIGFYYERPIAGAAATKAFVVNRIGDAGFLIGLAALLAANGDVRFVSLFEAAGAGELSRTALLIGGFGVLAGCVGKSAQFPLQVWLPDAMAGPTPVSALVHSATMVAGGVYLIGRMTPALPGEVLLTVAYLGCATALIGAAPALFQTDLKGILAYSSISQLGYMMLALGVTGWGAGLFHLVTHAFFKSLMFLCAGSVIVACHHAQDVTKLGGLMRKMPVTAGAMLVGVIAISGLAIPGVTLFGEALSFSGFHSKDAILSHALAFTEANPAHAILFWVPLVTAGLTALYMVRLWGLTFAGTPGSATKGAHESPAVMLAPILILAGLAAFCAIGGDGGPLYGFLTRTAPEVGTFALFESPTEAAVDEAHHHAEMMGLIAAGLGAAAGLALFGPWRRAPGHARAEGLKDAAVVRWLRSGWGFDAVYRALAVRPTLLAGEVAALTDRSALDGAVHGTATLARRVARFERSVDERLVDGVVRGVGRLARGFGRLFGATQSGGLRQYVAALAACAVGLAVLAVVLLAG
ncbi:NADH-quinone oxidoreductase subunit L [Alienimonas chondri]|uniref:NADH-quinone oxidoreductase subunit L n=1 Tax=Alienimonas chondri TaxID=2681879 RepID=A0ABX1VGL6_9PLAN|nr:NADH-quinone oxidoreductase subunit L [Alienimonas chondri]NNJ26705.1 NADH-quinone oxidoreductase subunit L [Alienimonas chondri]